MLARMICKARFSFSFSSESSSSLSKASARKDARRNAAELPKSNALLREKEDDDGEEILVTLRDEDEDVVDAVATDSKAKGSSAAVAEIAVSKTGKADAKAKSTRAATTTSEPLGRGTMEKMMPVPIPKATRLRVLVTGGAGFVGSHLVDRLMERGNIVIVADAKLCATFTKEFDSMWGKFSGNKYGGGGGNRA